MKNDASLLVHATIEVHLADNAWRLLNCVAKRLNCPWCAEIVKIDYESVKQQIALKIGSKNPHLYVKEYTKEHLQTATMLPE